MKKKLHDKVQRVIQDACSSLVARDEAVKLCALSMVARHNIFLFGPPGLAKSLLVEQLVARIDGASKFAALLTRFTGEDLIFGPVSLPDYERGLYRRVGTGMLQESHIAFLDETFKANASILNALLTIMNERRVSIGGSWVSCPTFCVVGASNEMPQGSDLAALYDRFLVRVNVRPITDDADLDRLLTAPRTPAPPSATITLAEVEAAQREVEGVKLPSSVLTAYKGLRHKLAAAGHQPSDRRLKAALALVQANAWLDGRDEAVLEDLAVTRHAFWSDPAEEKKIASLVYDVAVPGLSAALAHLDNAVEQHQKALAARPGSPQYLEATSALANIAEELGKLLDGVPNPHASMVEAEEKVGALQEEATRALTRRRR